MYKKVYCRKEKGGDGGWEWKRGISCIKIGDGGKQEKRGGEREVSFT